jgi:hypothetical protein
MAHAGNKLWVVFVTASYLYAMDSKFPAGVKYLGSVETDPQKMYFLT